MPKALPLSRQRNQKQCLQKKFQKNLLKIRQNLKKLDERL
jgi:hypothetical protein